MGLPFDEGKILIVVFFTVNNDYCKLLKYCYEYIIGTKITPLPEETKPAFLKELIDDALSKGAKIANSRGGQIDRTYVAPTVLTNVNDKMRIYHEEQFGPVVPVVKYKVIY